MKQYTSKDQTAKLIELGFPKPKHSSSVEEFEGKGWAGHIRVTFDYSIGELIEFLGRNPLDGDLREDIRNFVMNIPNC